jgi:hypothetical protein
MFERAYFPPDGDFEQEPVMTGNILIVGGRTTGGAA